MCYIKLKEGRTNLPTMDMEIAFFKAGGSYTFAHLKDGTFHKMSARLGLWEEHEDVIASGKFIRTHDSYLINYENVKEYDHWGAVMNDKDKTFVPLSREGYIELEKHLYPVGQKTKSYGVYPKTPSQPPATASSAISSIPIFISGKRDFRNDEEEE